MSEEMNELNRYQQYFVDEFHEDYQEGLLTRRQFIKKLAYIAGSMTATATIMSTLGCSPDEIPAATEPMPTLEPALATESGAEDNQAPPTSLRPNWRPCLEHKAHSLYQRATPRC